MANIVKIGKRKYSLEALQEEKKEIAKEVKPVKKKDAEVNKKGKK